jgi:hypothetical protein
VARPLRRGASGGRHVAAVAVRQRDRERARPCLGGGAARHSCREPERLETVAAHPRQHLAPGTEAEQEHAPRRSAPEGRELQLLARLSLESLAPRGGEQGASEERVERANRSGAAPEVLLEYRLRERVRIDARSDRAGRLHRETVLPSHRSLLVGSHVLTRSASGLLMIRH